MAYYDLRVTGHASELPYAVNQRRYALSPVFWAAPLPPPSPHVYRDKAMRDVWEWDLEHYEAARKNPLTIPRSMLEAVDAEFANGPMLPMLGFTILGLPLAARAARLRLAVALGAWFVLAVMMEKSIRLHYLAPAVPLLFLLTAVGARCVSMVRFRGVRVGGVVVLLAILASAAGFLAGNWRRVDTLALNKVPERFATEARLERLPGRHVVVVRYSPHHDFHAEYVYNGPDIDGQRIVWAIDRGAQLDSALQRYYRGRTFWLLTPDDPDRRLMRYAKH
jgi:hypothetical protein